MPVPGGRDLVVYLSLKLWSSVDIEKRGTAPMPRGTVELLYLAISRGAAGEIRSKTRPKPNFEHS